jgi:hypothetical protein
VRLREQTGRRLPQPLGPGCSDPAIAAAHEVLRKTKGTVNEPAEGEHLTRPPPASPFPDLVLELGRAIDRYLAERGAASRGELLLMTITFQSADRRKWGPVAQAVASVRERLLMEGLTRQEQAREREVR